jgi:hypothetical protein
VRKEIIVIWQIPLMTSTPVEECKKASKNPPKIRKKPGMPQNWGVEILGGTCNHISVEAKIKAHKKKPTRFTPKQISV